MPRLGPEGQLIKRDRTYLSRLGHVFTGAGKEESTDEYHGKMEPESLCDRSAIIPYEGLPASGGKVLEFV
jgi:hypothetical protein